MNYPYSNKYKSVYVFKKKSSVFDQNDVNFLKSQNLLIYINQFFYSLINKFMKNGFKKKLFNIIYSRFFLLKKKLMNSGFSY